MVQALLVLLIIAAHCANEIIRAAERLLRLPQALRSVARRARHAFPRGLTPS